MNKLLRSKTFWTVVLLAGVVIFIVFINSAKANPPTLTHNQTDASTSTVVYLKADSTVSEHSTSTISFLTNGADFIDLHLFVTPSSTVDSTLRFTVEHSINNIDWAGEDYIVQNPTIAENSFFHASSTPEHLWTPATTTATDLIEKVIRFSNVEGEYMRFVFNAQDVGNNLSFWADAVVTTEKP